MNIQNLTLSSVSNSTTETPVASATYGTGAILDGDRVSFESHLRHVNNSGSAANLKTRLNVTCNGVTQSKQFINSSVTSSAADKDQFNGLILVREGSLLLLFKNVADTEQTTPTPGYISATFTPDMDNFPVTFDLTVEWGTANANISSTGLYGKTVQY